MRNARIGKGFFGAVLLILGILIVLFLVIVLFRLWDRIMVF